jgi:hypothetical protein
MNPDAKASHILTLLGRAIEEPDPKKRNDLYQEGCMVLWERIPPMPYDPPNDVED